MYIALSYETYVTCDDDIVLTPGRLKSLSFFKNHLPSIFGYSSMLLNLMEAVKKSIEVPENIFIARYR